jgi:hypothetical protein
MKQPCTFVSCDDADYCVLVKGCVRARFPLHFKHVSASTKEAMRKDAPALNGQKPGRTNRDPALIPRRRKRLSR